MIVRANSGVSIPLADESVNCVVTSPPYWGLRDYKVPGQIGLEKTPAAYVTRLVAVFREVKRVLRKDGVCWVNLGDCFATGAGAANIAGGGKQGERYLERGPVGRDDKRATGKHAHMATDIPKCQPNRMKLPGLKPKDLIGMPWRLAFALQDDGWWLRQDVIWSKPNPMPESVQDRCTRSHEYLFMLTKSKRYFYDAEAIKEPGVYDSLMRADRANKGYAPPGQRPHEGIMAPRNNGVGWGYSSEADPNDGGPRKKRTSKQSAYSDRRYVGFNERCDEKSRLEKGAEDDGVSLTGADASCGEDAAPTLRNRGHKQPHQGFNEKWDKMSTAEQCSVMRNKRSVWSIATQPFLGAHFATFPEKLVEPCILSGCPAGGVVLDPFVGSGTTCRVAQRLGRMGIGLELNWDYCRMAYEHEERQMVLPAGA